MRRLVILLLAALLLAIHHGAPVVMDQSGMTTGKAAATTSLAPMIECVGVLAAAIAVIVLQALVRHVGRRRDTERNPGAEAIRLVAHVPRAQPPPTAPSLAMLCVIRR